MLVLQTLILVHTAESLLICRKNIIYSQFKSPWLFFVIFVSQRNPHANIYTHSIKWLQCIGSQDCANMHASPVQICWWDNTFFLYSPTYCYFPALSLKWKMWTHNYKSLIFCSFVNAMCFRSMGSLQHSKAGLDRNTWGYVSQTTLH